MDFYLKFNSEEEAKSVLYRMEGVVEANEEFGIEASPGYEVPNYRNIDTIGNIYVPTGETTEVDGMETPVMEAIEGWHVNVRLSEGENESPLNQYKVNVKSPMRVWG